MIKNNKGAALAYTLMVMILIFAICMAITSVMLAQFASSERYSTSAETERIYMQIGEIFCASQDGDSNYAAFESALKDNNPNNSVEANGDGWLVLFDGQQFLLNFSQTETVSTLEIKNANGTKLYLTVGVSVADGKIVEWTKGSD